MRGANAPTAMIPRKSFASMSSGVKDSTRPQPFFFPRWFLPLVAAFGLCALNIAFSTSHSPLQPWSEHMGMSPSVRLSSFSERTLIHLRNPNATCLTKECIRIEAAKLARAFPDRHDRGWCIKGVKKEHNADRDEYKGLILIKVPKVSSTTSAGLVLRVAYRNDCRWVQWGHVKAAKYNVTVPEETFIFSTVRDPASRALSTLWFHHFSRKDHLKTTGNFVIGKLKDLTHFHYGTTSKGQGGFQLRYMFPRDLQSYYAYNDTDPGVVQNPETVRKHVKEVIDTYGLIMPTNRMDEAVVVLALILGVDVGDVLVRSANVAGNRFHYSTGKCHPTNKASVSPEVKEYLASDDFRAEHYGDLLLHEAASQSLDLTIERLGKETFERALAEYRRLDELQDPLCKDAVVLPCDADGNPQTEASAQSCYAVYHDIGCGYKCIDYMLEGQPKLNYSLPITPLEAVCLTDSCIKEKARRLARAFPERKEKTSWCSKDPSYNPFQDRDQYRGLLNVRVLEAASDATAALIFRLMRRNHCHVYEWDFENMAKVDRRQSFMMTAVRDPAARAVEAFWNYEASRHEVPEPDNDKLIIAGLKTYDDDKYGSTSRGQGGFQLKYANHKKIPEWSFWDTFHPDTVQNLDRLESAVLDTIQSYDFIVDADRLDESLVAIALLLNISVEDVMVPWQPSDEEVTVITTTTTKIINKTLSGNITDSIAGTETTKTILGGYRMMDGRCVQSPEAVNLKPMRPKIEEFLNSNEWRAANYGDYLYHEVVRQSLDLTIEALGQKRFEEALSEYHRMKEFIAESCAEIDFDARIGSKRVCSSKGVLDERIFNTSTVVKNCYFASPGVAVGCGYPCIQKAIKRYRSMDASLAEA